MNIKEYITNFTSRAIIPLTCEICHKNYTRNKHSIVRSLNKGKFTLTCSLRCVSIKQGQSAILSCHECDTPFHRPLSEIKKSKYQFCSAICSATYYNRSRIKFRKCAYCNTNTKNKKFCSHKCTKRAQRIERINNGTATHKVWRTYLLDVSGNTCSNCQLSEWNNKPIPIELDHIDGNYQNNNKDNVRLLCPNCHAQTPTYGAKNRGNGRHYRRQRYHEGKSW